MLSAACLLLALNFFCMLGARLLGLLPTNGHPFIYLRVLAGTGVDIVGIDSGSAPGSIEPAVLRQLGWFTVLLTSGMALVAGGFYRRIRMTRNDLETIRRRLAQREAP